MYLEGIEKLTTCGPFFFQPSIDCMRQNPSIDRLFHVASSLLNLSNPDAISQSWNSNSECYQVSHSKNENINDDLMEPVFHQNQTEPMTAPNFIINQPINLDIAIEKGTKHDEIEFFSPTKRTMQSESPVSDCASDQSFNRNIACLLSPENTENNYFRPIPQSNSQVDDFGSVSTASPMRDFLYALFSPTESNFK